jgi:hypothetical protein
MNPQLVEVFNDVQNQRIGIRAPLNYTGSIMFDFTVSDGRGGETTQTAYGSVSAVNDVPYLTTQRTAISSQRFGRSNLIDLSTWQVSAWDPDNDQSVQIGIARNPLRGAVGITGTSVAPDSRGGMLTGVILGMAEAIGQTAPIITIGALTFIAFLPEMPVTGEFPFLSMQWIWSEFTVLPIQMYNWVSRPNKDFQINAAAAGVVLLFMTLMMNGLAIYLRYQVRKKIKW